MMQLNKGQQYVFDIVNEVFTKRGYSFGKLRKNKSHEPKVCLRRHAFMYCLLVYGEFSTKEIAVLFLRSRYTVNSAYRNVDNILTLRHKGQAWALVFPYVNAVRKYFEDS